MTTMTRQSLAVTVGIDTHADVHVAAAVDQQGRVLGTVEVAATPRSPWQPCTTMLTYRLAGTTEESVSTGTDQPILAAGTSHGQPTPGRRGRRIFASHGEPLRAHRR